MSKLALTFELNIIFHVGLYEHVLGFVIMFLRIAAYKEDFCGNIWTCISYFYFLS